MLSTYLTSHVPMPWGHVDTDVFAAWGQWAGGFGSILAVAVALYVLRRDRKIHTNAMEVAARQGHEDLVRARADEERRRVAHARTVVGGYADVENPRTRSDGRVLKYKVPGIKIGNYGTRPVLEVTLESIAFNADIGGIYREWSVSAPARFGVSALNKQFRAADLLGPGDYIELLHLTFNGLDDGARDHGTTEVTFSFLDAEGYRWRRVGSAEPVQISEDEAA